MIQMMLMWFLLATASSCLDGRICGCFSPKDLGKERFRATQWELLGGKWGYSLERERSQFCAVVLQIFHIAQQTMFIMYIHQLHIYIYIHIYIYTYLYISRCLYIYIYLSMYISLYLNIFICTYIYSSCSCWYTCNLRSSIFSLHVAGG